MDIRDRVIELRRVKASELVPNPKNWRKHPAHQRKALKEIVGRIGFAGAELVRVLEDGRLMLIDGHERADVFNNAVLPVLVTDLSEEEADAILATFDPLAAMAQTDHDKLEALLRDVAGLFQAAEPVEIMPEGLADEVAAAFEPVLGAGDVPDALWPTDNDYDVPVLDLAMQADALDLPVSVWGMGKYTKKMRGTWLFYTDDKDFKALWDDPTPVLNTLAVNAAEINFSIQESTPFPLALWRTYQKRWIARYWQSQGLRVLVDLNVHPQYMQMNLLGVPAGWGAYCTRYYTTYPDEVAAQYEAAAAHCGKAPALFVVYSGGDAARKLCQARGWTWVADINGYKSGRQKIADGDAIKAVKVK